MEIYDYKLLIVVLFTIVPLEAVTVSPALCPTNKIAPYKRHAAWEYGSARTFGAFYDLLAPGGGQAPYGPQYEDNNLQEQPQEDDPNDCGEIDDYDENDLSSVTPQKNRRQGYGNRYFFGRPQNNNRPPSNYPQRPPQYPQRPPSKPQRPPNYPQRPPNNPQRPPNYPQRPPSTVKPLQPTRPPYWSGGFFGSNDYRPPSQQYPSANIKPIHEYSDNSDGSVSYRPSVVGGSLGHVVGVSPIIPSTEAPTSRPEFNNSPLTPQSDNSAYPTAPRRPRFRNVNSQSVLGSFADLFFK